jgi:hypothetical protein
MEKAMEQHRKGKVEVVPIILRPCAWQITSLKELQALPQDGTPVTSWQNVDNALYDISINMINVVKYLSDRSTTRATPQVPLSSPNKGFSSSNDPISSAQLNSSTSQSFASQSSVTSQNHSYSLIQLEEFQKKSEAKGVLYVLGIMGFVGGIIAGSVFHLNFLVVMLLSLLLSAIAFWGFMQPMQNNSVRNFTKDRFKNIEELEKEIKRLKSRTETS